MYFPEIRSALVLSLLAVFASASIAGAQNANSKISPDLVAAPANQQVQCNRSVLQSTPLLRRRAGCLGLLGGILEVGSFTDQCHC